LKTKVIIFSNSFDIGYIEFPKINNVFLFSKSISCIGIAFILSLYL
jgi:hypothetical protein